MNDWHWRLLARHFAAVATPEEETWLAEWMRAKPGRPRLVEDLRRVWEISGSAPVRNDAGRVWRRVAAGIRADGETGGEAGNGAGAGETSPPAAHKRVPNAVPRSDHHSRPPPGRSRARRLVAGIAIAAGAVLLWRGIVVDREPPAVEMNEYSTRPGQRAELRLHDGSRILLNVDSRIRFPSDFSSNAREVALDGEAFFDIRHDVQRPFRVRTQGAVAEVLGTEFVVTAYPEGDRERHRVNVAVVSGSVGIRPEEAMANMSARPDGRDDSGFVVRLSPGDVALLGPLGELEVRRETSLAPHIGWIDGSLVFNGTPLAEALPRIGRWYDVALHLEDEGLAERRLTATFRGDSLDAVLDLLALSFDLRVERRGHTIHLVPKAEVEGN